MSDLENSLSYSLYAIAKPHLREVTMSDYGTNAIARAMECPTRYGKARYTRKGGNPDKGIIGKKSNAPKTKVRKARI